MRFAFLAATGLFLAVAGSAPEVRAIPLAGYMDTSLDGKQGGALRMVAYDPEGPGAIALVYQGVALDVALQDYGTDGDTAAGDGWYTLDTRLDPVAAGNYLLELSVFSLDRPLAGWPYLIVSDGPDFSPTPAPTSPPVEPPRACGPLSLDTCLMPFPSSHYLVPDASTATGFRVHVPSEAMPRDNDPARLNLLDGWGLQGSILAEFSGTLDTTGFPGFDDPEATLDEGSRFLLFNADGRSPNYGRQYGVRVQTEFEGGITAVMMVPAETLEPDTRYIVAMRDLRTASGARAGTSRNFERLRDGRAAGTEVEGLIPLYDGIFRFLAGQGYSAGKLDLAWDFRTASVESLTGIMTRMADDANDRFDPAKAEWRVTAEDASEGKLYTCVCAGPNYITGDKRFQLDDQGQPRFLGNAFFRFLVYVPESALEVPDLPVPVVLFGHGMGGSAERVRNQYLDRLGYVGVAVDWTGLQKADYVDLATTILVGPITRLPTLSDRLMQSVVNATLVSRLLPRIAGFLEDEFGEPVMDPARHYYFGESLGGIMGSLVMAVHPSIPAGVLIVPGGNFTQIIQHTDFFSDEIIDGLTFQDLIDAIYSDPIEQQLLFALMQEQISVADPVSFAGHWSMSPLGARQPRHILMQEGIGDTVVPNHCTSFLLSASGLPLLQPAEVPILGVPMALTPTNGSHFGGCSQYPEGGHEAGKNPGALAQQKAFLRSFYDAEYGPAGNIR